MLELVKDQKHGQCGCRVIGKGTWGDDKVKVTVKAFEDSLSTGTTGSRGTPAVNDYFRC